MREMQYGTSERAKERFTHTERARASDTHRERASDERERERERLFSSLPNCDLIHIHTKRHYVSAEFHAHSSLCYSLISKGVKEACLEFSKFKRKV